MTRFGDFKPFCSQFPSYPWCNLFYRQLSRLPRTSNATVNLPSPLVAPVGINPECGIPRVGNGSLGNIANILACVLSMIAVVLLIFKANRRKAAVGRLEISAFLGLYFLTLALQLITIGSFLAQGSTPLVVFTAIHAGAVSAVFWTLVANAIISTQVVDDGTMSSFIPFAFFTLCFFALPMYIAIDVALGITPTFGHISGPANSLHSIPLFIFTSIIPGVALLLYFGITTYVVVVRLNQFRPMWWFILSFTIFLLSQLVYFLLSKFICKGSKQKVDGSFIATLLETASVWVLYLGWRSITEDAWEDEPLEQHQDHAHLPEEEYYYQP